MEQYYTINEYDSTESHELYELYEHKYKCNEIKKIRETDLSIEEHFDKTDDILAKDIHNLLFFLYYFYF